jgi:hypothetical protein
MKKTTAIIFILVSMLMIPLEARALTPPLLSFGGTARSQRTCTCSDATWMMFSPLHIGGAVMSGPMAFTPSVKQFSDYMGGRTNVIYLGAFMPGVQACWMQASYFCYPLVNYGVMSFIGTKRVVGK